MGVHDSRRQRWQEHEILSRISSMAGGGQIITDIDKQSFIDVLRPIHPTLVTEPKWQGVLKRVQVGESGI